MKFEQAILEEKTTKIEKVQNQFQEMEIKYQKEIESLQNEINKMRDDDQYRSLFNNITVGDNFNTQTHRKMNKGENIFKTNHNNNGTPISINYNSQKHLITHKKAMSISSNAIANNIKIPGSHSTKKKTTNVRKIKGDIQKNLIKGHVNNKGDNDSNTGILELSTRTPEKTNPELSPYMMEFYK